MIRVDNSWKPKKFAQKKAYFSNKHGPRPQPSGKEYVPKLNHLYVSDQNRSIVSRVAETPDPLPVRVQYEGEMADREAKAKERKFCVMAGHKQGYEVVTDPELMKVMGKKTA